MDIDRKLDIAGLEWLRPMVYVLPEHGWRAIAIVVEFVQFEWDITNIQVHPDLRQRGLGSQILRSICAAADAQQTVLHLQVEAQNYDGLDDNQLLTWYERYGFVSEDGTNFNMVRRPKIVTHAHD